MGRVGLLIMKQQVVDVGVAQVHNLRDQAIETDALVPILPENHRLPMLKHKSVIILGAAVGDVAPRTIVEDIAVLEDLDEGGPFVLGGPKKCCAEVFGVEVNAASNKCRFGSQREPTGVLLVTCP